MIDKEKLREKKRAYRKKYKAEAKLAYAALMKFYPLDLQSLVNEIWAEIEGYGGMYLVSNYGRVMSFYKGTVRILRPQLSHLYLAVTLLSNGKPKICSVHILVARAFIPNPEGKPEVNHIDGVKLNCFIENLEWVTQSENTKHAFRIGRKKSKHGVENTLAKLTEDQVREICRIFVPYSHKYGIRALARKYGVAINTITKVIRGMSYKNVPRDDDGEKS